MNPPRVFTQSIQVFLEIYAKNAKAPSFPHTVTVIMYRMFTKYATKIRRDFSLGYFKTFCPRINFGKMFSSIVVHSLIFWYLTGNIQFVELYYRLTFNCVAPKIKKKLQEVIYSQTLVFFAESKCTLQVKYLSCFFFICVRKSLV